MSRSKPTTAEVTAFDKEIREGQVFANTYNAHVDNVKKGQRQIRITNKAPGNIVEYVTTAHPNSDVVGRTGVMTTKNLYSKFEKIGG